MSKLSKDQAVEYGEKLSKELGEGWNAKVFNNHGWHVSAESQINKNSFAVVEMNPTNEKNYGNFGCEIIFRGDNVVWSTSFSSDKPKEVFKNELKSFSSYADSLMEDLKEFRKLDNSNKKTLSNKL